jgi:uncharacterized integral membrane protein
VRVTTALWLVLIAVLVAAVAVFAVANAGPVEIRFLSFHHAASLALVVIGSFICGGLAVAGVSAPGRVRLELRLRRLERRLAAVLPSAATGETAAPLRSTEPSGPRPEDETPPPGGS